MVLLRHGWLIAVLGAWPAAAPGQSPAPAGRSDDAVLGRYDREWEQHYRAARYAQSIAVSREGLARAEELEGVPDQLVFLSRLAYEHWLMGSSELALDYAHRIIPVADRLRDESALSRGHRYLSLITSTLGDPVRARTHAQTALAHGARSGIPDDRIFAVEALAETSLAAGDLGAARRGFTEVRDYWLGRNWRWNTANSHADLARVAAAEGDHAGALTLMAGVLAERIQFSDRRGQVRAACQISRLLRALGRPDEALRRLTATATLTEEIGGDQLLEEFHAELAAVQEVRGEFAGALAAERLATQARLRLAGERAQVRAADLSSRLELAGKERALVALALEHEKAAAAIVAQAAELARARVLRLALAGGLALGTLALGVVIWAARGRLRAERGARAAAEEADRLKTNFLGIASHDLRAPLRLLVRSAEQIARAPGDSTAVLALAARIRAESESMAALVRDLLDVAALQAGKLELHPAPLDLGALAREVVASHEPAAQRKEQPLVLQLVDETGLGVIGDRARLRQVLDNLIDNAIKFTPVGGTVRVAVLAEAGAVCVQVLDEGPGLVPADLAAMFEPFRPLSARPTGGEPSRGLGLSIVRQLVTLHGGSINVETEPGRGATFTVRLRAAAVGVAPHALPPAGTAASRTAVL